MTATKSDELLDASVSFLEARLQEDEQIAHGERAPRDVEAKRRIINRYKHAAQKAKAFRIDYRTSAGFGSTVPLYLRLAQQWEGIADTLLGSIRDLATAYSDHSEYLEEWES